MPGTAFLVAVENDAAFRELALAAGHRLRAAGSVSDALAALRAEPADVVLLDGGAGGLDLCGAIRSLDVRQPVIVALGRDGEAVRSLEAGADAFVRRPIEQAELLARAAALLRLARRERELATPAILDFGGLRIEQARRRVLVHGRPVRFTPRELDLLLFLARRAGTVQRREHLLREVWGYHHHGYLRTVDTHVMRVRRKLARAGLGGGALTTLNRVGYVFDPPAGDAGMLEPGRGGRVV